MTNIQLISFYSFLVFLILFSGFFSASEIGMMSANRYKLRHLAKQGYRPAQRVMHLLERPDRLLGVVLIGNTFANILASAVATILAVELWGQWGTAISAILLTLIVLIFAEIAPKTVAALHPEKVAYLVSRPLSWLLFLFSPLVWLANGTSNFLLRLVGVRVQHRKKDQLSPEELRSIVYEAGGFISNAHQEMLIRILDLSKVTVDDIMIPRHEVIGIDLAAPLPEIQAQLRHSQHTRLPLYRETLESVHGLVHMRDAMRLILEDNLTVEALLKIAANTYFVPEGTPLHVQLHNFQLAKTRSGLVVDEYGDIQGLVTLEDILEEIVGEFTTNVGELVEEIQPQADGSMLIEGSSLIREINRELGWQLPTDGPKTLSGLITEYLEFIPPEGTCLRITDYIFETIEVKENIVKLARVKPFKSDYKQILVR